MAFFLQEDNVAEWLRRQPAKLMGFARVGSNPTVVVFCCFLFCKASVAEWLRRQTQVLVNFVGVSSILTGCTFCVIAFLLFHPTKK